MSKIYLDYHTESPPCSPCIERVVETFNNHWHCPTSVYPPAQDVLARLDQAEGLIYDFVGAKAEDSFFFTSSGKEAVDKTILSAYFDVVRKTGKTHFITSSVEDASIILALKGLEKLGCKLHMIKVNSDGLIDLEELQNKVGPRTAMACFSWAHPLTGVIQDMASISKICEDAQTLLHVDASFIMGKVYLPFEETSMQYLTFAGSGIHGPKGSGGIFVRKGYLLSSQIAQDDLIETSFLDTSSFLGLGYACQQAHLMIDHLSTQTAELRELFEKKIEEKGGQILFRKNQRLPNVSCIVFPKIHSEMLLYRLTQRGVYATFGGGKFQQLVNVLQACSFDEEKSYTALSFALSRYTTRQEIEKAAEIVCEELEALQVLSEDL